MESAGFFDERPPWDREDHGLDDETRQDCLEMLRRCALKPAREWLLRTSRSTILAEAFLMDANILAARSAAQLVVGVTMVGSHHWLYGVPVPKHMGDSEGQAWVVARVSEALRDLITEDRWAVHCGTPQSDPLEPRHLYLCDWLGIGPDYVSRAALQFNNLGVVERKSFFHVFVKRSDLSQVQDPRLGTPEQIKEHATRAVRSMVDPIPPNLEGLYGAPGLL
ncbi:MAG: hypothetical protein R3F33_17775 [Planctomycetota bacterium]